MGGGLHDNELAPYPHDGHGNDYDSAEAPVESHLTLVRVLVELGRHSRVMLLAQCCRI